MGEHRWACMQLGLSIYRKGIWEPLANIFSLKSTMLPQRYLAYRPTSMYQPDTLIWRVVVFTNSEGVRDDAALFRWELRSLQTHQSMQHRWVRPVLLTEYLCCLQGLHAESCWAVFALLLTAYLVVWRVYTGTWVASLPWSLYCLPTLCPGGKCLKAW